LKPNNFGKWREKQKTKFIVLELLIMAFGGDKKSESFFQDCSVKIDIGIGASHSSANLLKFNERTLEIHLALSLVKTDISI